MRVGRLNELVTYEGEGDGGAGGGAAGGDDVKAQLAHWQTEAKQAFKARDDLKNKLRDLEGRVLSDEDRATFETLKTQAAQLEEERAKKAGEFDTLKTQMAERHQQAVKAKDAEIAKRDETINRWSERFKDKVKKAEFGAAVDYFSGADGSKTILDVEMGMAILGRFVDVAVDDNGDAQVIVKKPNGDVILGADGNPAAFADGIGELIKTLPNKDRILRGSGKTGSGSSGGKTGGDRDLEFDVANLTPEQRRDPKVLAELKRRLPRGGMVSGRAYDQ